MARRDAVALLWLVLLACPEIQADSRGSSKPRVGREFLVVGQTVEARGRFADGRFLATRFEIEEPDNEVTLKGLWQPSPAGAESRIGGVAFAMARNATVVDTGGRRLTRGALEPGSWAKAECVHRGDSLLLRKLTLRVRRSGEDEEIQGRVTQVDEARGRLLIGGVEVVFASDVPVFWDVDGRAPPPPGAAATGQLVTTAGGRRRLEPVDEEDRRPGDQISIGGRLTIGGELQYEIDWRRNFDLDIESRRDLLLHQPSARVELSLDISERFFAFVKGGAGRKLVAFDQDRDVRYGTNLVLDEAFLHGDDIWQPWLSLRLGRQDFDHGREWLMDDQLDAVRIFVGRQGLTLQASVSTVMLDPDPREEGVVNVLLAAGWQPDGGFDLLLYGLRRIGGTLTRLDRTHAGMSLETQIERWTAWLDIALVSGAEDELQVRGVGFDAMVMFELLDLPLSPYLYGGLARGSSKIDSSTGLQVGFRQSGLHDNNAKLGGVASFRYLGELLRPELSNMRVLTAGAGASPLRDFSIDLIYHQYRQVQAARFLREARVRRSPNGESPEIGSEIDLVIGVERIGHLDLEVVGALFLPGTAFDIRDDAWFLATEAEWNF